MRRVATGAWRRGAVRGAVRAVVEHPIGGPGLLAAFVLFVYYDGFWGVPRSDQLVYLYDAAQFPRFVDLLVRAPVWERSVGVGDHILFRPILQLLLAFEYGLFGYTFSLWQATGIGLHVAQSIALFRLFRRASPATGELNLAASGLFGSLLISCEAVIWHHISGYILFALCMTSSVLCVLRYLETGRRLTADGAILLAIVAAFTYELGSIYCLFVALGLALSAGRWAPAAGATPAPGPRARRALALAFAAVPVAYVTVSLTDFYLRFTGLPRLASGRSPALEQGLTFTARQIGFWLGGALLPAVHEITWGGGRSFFQGYRWSTDAATLLNLAAVCAAVPGGVGCALITGQRAGSGVAVRAALGAGLLVAYSSLIAFGRSVPRGLSHTLDINLHYAYIALVIAAGAVALALPGSRPRTGHDESGTGGATGRAPLLGGRLLLIGLLGLAAINAWTTMSLLSDYRRVYAARVTELMHHARRWHETREPGDYFLVKEGCPGNQRLPWFRLYLRRDTDEVRFLDVLYPATSANLHRAEAASPGARVRPLSCTDGRVDPRALLGTWKAQGGSPGGRLAPDGRVELVDEHGSASGVVAEGRLLFATQWSVAGMVSHDDRHIFWGDGRTWWR